MGPPIHSMSAVWSASARIFRLSVALVGLWAQQAAANLIFDPTLTGLASLFPDKIQNDAVFAKYGQNPWGSTGGGVFFDTNVQFLGAQFNTGTKSLGGIACEFGVCLGAEVRGSASGTVGAVYQFQLDTGSLDIRYPVQISLDLPYESGGLGTPEIGDTFKISSSWSVQAPQVVGSPGQSSPLSPLLAVHGPQLRAFIDLIAKFKASVGAEVCAVVGCLGDDAPFAIDKDWELAAINRSGDGAVTIMGDKVSANSPGEAANGIIQYVLNHPSLDAQGGLGADGKTLSAGTQDLLADVKLGIDELISEIFLGGFPLHDDFGFSIGGKHIGVGYNILDAGAGFAMFIAQQIGFTAAPTIELLFGSPVQVKQADGSFGDPTYKIVFNAGDSIELRAPGVQVLGVIPTFGLPALASNDTDLKLEAKVNVEALGISSTLGPLGPLVPLKQFSAPVSDYNVFDKSFAVDMGKVVGGAFNMAFLPSTVYTTGSMTPVLGFWDPTQWQGGPDDCVLDVCSFLPQSQVLGFFPLIDRLDPLRNCFSPDGCDWGLFGDLIGATSFDPIRTSSRLWGELGGNVFLGDLLALMGPQLSDESGISDEESQRRIAALQAALVPTGMAIPPFPAPEPSTFALAAGALSLLGMMRRRSRRALRS